jgi:integral membrane sensor domain MASE1
MSGTDQSLTRAESFQVFRGPLLPSVTRLVVVFLLVGITCWGGITLSRESGRIAAIWPANALTLVFLLVSPRRSAAAWSALSAAAKRYTACCSNRRERAFCSIP